MEGEGWEGGGDGRDHAPRPSCRFNRAFARTHCPERIMQPHPESLVKPAAWSGSWLLKLVKKLKPPVFSTLLGIGAKSLRYVIQILLSKSSRKAFGHTSPAPPPSPSSARVGGEEGELRTLLHSADGGGAAGNGGRMFGYSRPRHQMEFMASVFFGSGSHRNF